MESRLYKIGLRCLRCLGQQCYMYYVKVFEVDIVHCGIELIEKTVKGTKWEGPERVIVK